MRQDVMGFLDAVASAGPYASNLHLAADTQFLPRDAMDIRGTSHGPVSVRHKAVFYRSG